MSVGTKSKKQKKSKKSKRTITFEEEIVTRDDADKYLQKQSPQSVDLRPILGDNSGDGNHKSNNTKRLTATCANELEVGGNKGCSNEGKLQEGKQDPNVKKAKKQKRKKQNKQRSSTEEVPHTSTAVTEVEVSKKPKKRKRDKSAVQEVSSLNSTIQEISNLNITRLSENGGEEESDSISSEKRKKLDEGVPSEGTEPSNSAEVVPKKESIRQRKRKKHLILIEEKKTKVELQLQQKALEYLSRWKHSRNTWRFEKLKQIWLQQNLFDPAKLPSEFWANVLEYFTSAKGKVTTTLIQKALKIIEENKSKKTQEEHEDDDEAAEAEGGEDEDSVKAKRARDIVQYLQEG